MYLFASVLERKLLNPSPPTKVWESFCQVLKYRLSKWKSPRWYRECGVKHDPDIRKQHCSSYRHIHLSKIMHGDNLNLTSVTKNKHTNIQHHTSGNWTGLLLSFIVYWNLYWVPLKKYETFTLHFILSWFNYYDKFLVYSHFS